MGEAVQRQRAMAMAISGGYCEHCGNPISARNSQMSHRIGDTIANRKKYGDFVIDHWKNVGMTCSLECNGKLDISRNPAECARIARSVWKSEMEKLEYGDNES